MATRNHGRCSCGKKDKQASVGVACLIVALASAASGAWVLVTRPPVPEFLSLPFGLFTTAAVVLLLSLDGLIVVAARRCSRRPTHATPAIAPIDASGIVDAHTLPLAECARALNLPSHATVLLAGLSSADVARGRALRPDQWNDYAPPVEKSSPWRALAKEVHEPQQVLLLVVAVLYSLLGQVEEAALALGIIALVVLAEVATEYRAKAAVRALAVAAPHFARVRRDGVAVSIPRGEVLPGDVLLLRAGDEVAADARLASAAQLQCDESKLTGEAVPVSKTPRVLPLATPLAGRTNTVFAGSIVTRGAGCALVMHIGDDTQLGRAMASVAAEKLKQKATPLQRLLKRLAFFFTLAALGGSVGGALLGVWRGMRWQAVVLTGLSLAFATIPEELPILVTAVLGLGAQALSRSGVYVKRLRAMEALACVDVLLTDKTGTLTRNELRLAAAILPADAGEDCGSVAPAPPSGATRFASCDGAVAVPPLSSGAGGSALDRAFQTVDVGSDAAAVGRQMAPLLMAWRLMQSDLPPEGVTTPSAVQATTAADHPSAGPSTAASPLLPHAAVVASPGAATAAPSAADPFDAAVLRAGVLHPAAASSLTGAAADTVGGGAIPPLSPLLVDVPFSSQHKWSARVFASTYGFEGEAAASTRTGAAIAPPACPTVLLCLKGAPERLWALHVFAARCAAAASGSDDASTRARLKTVGASLQRGTEAAASQGRRMIAFATTEVPLSSLPPGLLISGGPSAAGDTVTSASTVEALPQRSSRGAWETSDSVDDTGHGAIERLLNSGCCDLRFHGVLCFEDPLLPTVPAAVAECQRAGIRVVMVTGDHALAAASIAAQAGIAPADISDAESDGVASLTVYQAAAALQKQPSAGAGVTSWHSAGEAFVEVPVPVQAAHVLPSSNVVARATPGDKLRLTQACRSAGHVVAVTGDGVNDGPALAAADVGFAVPGATDVAQAAATIVIVSGGFPAFLLAIKEGRRLHANLTHALAFYLGCKLGLVLLFVVGTLWAGFPLAPVQVVLLELFMDLGASASFVTEAAEAGVMRQPPRRPDARFLDSLMLARIVAGAASMAGMVLGGFALGLHWSDGSLAAGQTLAFLCWLLGHVLLAINQRTAVEPLLVSKPLLGNPFFGAWLAAVGLVALLVAFSPDFRACLGLTSVSGREWGAVLALCTAGTCWIEAAKWGRWLYRYRRGREPQRPRKRSISADAAGNHGRGAAVDVAISHALAAPLLSSPARGRAV